MRSVSVYVHFPWCARKCPYCDFATKGVDPRTIPHEAYAEAVINELKLRKDALQDRHLLSVFFGGGTPSLWSGEQLGRVLAAIRSCCASEANDLEVTAECNPASFDTTQANAFMTAGVNRFSIGIQSLNDQQLRFLGRLHDRQSALRALNSATSTNARVSGDLIFGMPEHTPDEFESHIRELVDTSIDHLSAYSLTIENGTPFGEMKKSGRLKIATDDAYADLYERGEALLSKLGFEHYEVSNYARPDERSRHNMHYWRGGDYVGIGAAAVGCVDGPQGNARRWRNQPDADAYMSAKDLQTMEHSEEKLDGDDIVREAFLLGLRTTEGMHVESVAKRSGIDPVQSRIKSIELHQNRGNLVLQDGYLRIPHSRWYAFDGIVCDLF